MQAASTGTPAAYFPPSLSVPVPSCRFGTKVVKSPVLSEFAARWYSDHLQAAEEPSLSERPVLSEQPEGSVIRFTWLRSFDPPIVVRVEGHESGSPRLIAKQLSGAGGYAPGKIAATIDRPLTASETQELHKLLSDTRLAQPLPSGSTLKRCGPPGLDGAEWIVEVVNRRGYHFAKDWSPRAGDVRQVGLAMLALTGWIVEPVY
jgi:hypothetical protein